MVPSASITQQLPGVAKKGTVEPTSLTYDQALDEALAVFDILTSQNRFAVLHRLEFAERTDTRARIVEQFVAMLARSETPYPQKRTATS